MRITDREVLDRLVRRYKTPAAVMDALGLDLTDYYNWCRRGIPRGWRRTIWMICRERDIRFSGNFRLTEAWCDHDKLPSERAAIERALRSVRPNNNGVSHGEAGKAEAKSKRARATGQRPPPRRAAAGRSVPAPPR